MHSTNLCTMGGEDDETNEKGLEFDFQLLAVLVCMRMSGRANQVAFGVQLITASRQVSGNVSRIAQKCIVQKW